MTLRASAPAPVAISSGRKTSVGSAAPKPEAAARAYSRTEDPTASGLKNVVDTVVTEKVEDGQLEKSQLTFGDLTRIKAELVRALMGYYHARVPYPGFPGPKATTRARASVR